MSANDTQADLQEALTLLRSLLLEGGRVEPSSVVLRNTITDTINLLRRNVTAAATPDECGWAEAEGLTRGVKVGDDAQR